MACGKCGGGCGLCPMSLGLALAITSSLAVIAWTLVGLYQGVEDITLGASSLYVLMVFIKSFIFGFVLALVYGWIARCCKGWCCRKANSDD